MIGLGDMLFQAPDAPAPKRLQGVFVANNEIQKLVRFLDNRQDQALNAASASRDHEGRRHASTAMPAATLTKPLFDKAPDPDEDPLLKKAIEIVRKEERASISMLQRKLRVGYTRAARMVDRLEELEIIGKPEMGSGVRPVLDFGDEEVRIKKGWKISSP